VQHAGMLVGPEGCRDRSEVSKTRGRVLPARSFRRAGDPVCRIRRGMQWITEHAVSGGPTRRKIVCNYKGGMTRYEVGGKTFSRNDHRTVAVPVQYFLFNCNTSPQVCFNSNNQKYQL